jgi:prefoldin subunit 5
MTIDSCIQTYTLIHANAHIYRYYCMQIHTSLVVPVWSDFDIKPDAIRAAEILQKAINKKRKILKKPVVIKMEEVCVYLYL